MKYFVLFFVIAFSSGTIAQSINKIIPDSKSGKPMLIGICDRQAFSDSNFAWWFNSEYELYSVDNEIASQKEFYETLEYKTIMIVMGTWCSDSRREVPRLYKILDSINFPEENISLIMVDRSKKAGRLVTDEMNIEFVPTIIVLSGEEELGRIIEAPEETLEADLFRIASSR